MTSRLQNPGLWADKLKATSTTSTKTQWEEQSNLENVKTTASEVPTIPTTTTAKIKKTEESIKLLRNILQRNTCPKPLEYSMWSMYRH